MSRLFQNLWITEIPRGLMPYFFCIPYGRAYCWRCWQPLSYCSAPKPGPVCGTTCLPFLFTGFAVMVLLTFAWSFRPAGGDHFSFLKPSGNSSSGLFSDNAWNTAFHFINAHAGTLMSLWLIAFSFKSLRLLQDISGLNLLRKSASPVTDPYWIARLQEFKSKLNISGIVNLKESARLKGPSVSGILKPVILLPLGMLSQLPADQIEAILLHELAHIRRKDYLFNLVQTFFETIFFFNPFICWLSARLRTERENCCDAIAVDVSQNKAALVKALLSFGAQQGVPGNFAMALGSKKPVLLDRVKRIALNKNKSLDSAEKSFLVLFSVAILTFLCTFSWNIQQQINGKTDNSYDPLLQHPAPGKEASQEPLKPADIKCKTNKPCLTATTPAGAQRNLSRTETQSATITTINNLPGTDTLTLNRNILTDLKKKVCLQKHGSYARTGLMTMS